MYNLVNRIMKEEKMFLGQKEYESWYNWLFLYVILLICLLCILILNMTFLNSTWNYVHRYSLYLEENFVGYINLFKLTFLLACFWKLINPIRYRLLKNHRDAKREYFSKKAMDKINLM
tara:strand:+ start:135 stop:488 length:354 start_codon:yes stop_codon:yes gene_type:complete